MKWRASIRVKDGEITEHINLYNRCGFSVEEWEKIVLLRDGCGSSYGGNWWYVEVDDEEVNSDEFRPV